MNKKQIILNAIISVICVALIIMAAVIGLAKSDIYAGAGGKTSARIETIEQVEKMLSSFQSRLTGYTLDNGVAPVAKLIATDTEEYTSLTIDIVSHADMSYKRSLYNNGKRSSEEMSMNFDRRMTAYFTEEASYYVSDFEIYSHTLTVNTTNDNYNNSDTERQEHNMFMSVRMHIYLEKDFAMLRIDRMESVADGEAANAQADVLGKWVYFSDSEEDEYNEVVSSLTSVNSNNFKVLAVMSEYISKTERFKKDKQVYTLLDDYTNTFINDMLTAQFGLSYSSDDEEKSNGSFKVDLSDKTEPILRIDVGSSFWQSQKTVSTLLGSYNQPEISYNSSGSDIMNFGNINNTVISAPPVDGALSPEELQDLVRKD